MSDIDRKHATATETPRASLADSTALTLVLASVIAASASYALHQLRPSDFLSGLQAERPTQRLIRVAQVKQTDTDAPGRPIGAPASAAPETTDTGEPADWLAAAPGRVEPRGGETRLTLEAAGRIAQLHVALGDAVEAGDLIAVIDDRDVRARIRALRTNELSLRKDRDDVNATSKPAQDRRRRTDELAAAERKLSDARIALDDAVVARRTASGSAEEVTRTRTALAEAEKSVVDARIALTRALAVANLPAPTRIEAALDSSRSELSLAEIALDRHRLRAPIAGQVIELNVKVGEMASPQQPLPHIVLGDLAGLRLRAEVEERDIAKVRMGQQVVAKSTAFPGQTFSGKVTSIAPALGAPRLMARGPRKPSDVEVLEVLIDLTGTPPLKPGQRIDVYFTKDGGA